jgi:exonuclease SbcC
VNAEGNLEAKTQAVGEARQARDKALHRLAQFQKALEQLQSTLDRVKTLQAQSSEIEERYAVAGQLADVAKGKNPAKLDFERYVLGVMLDDVLQSSAQRLKTMSRGRYTLHRSLSLEDGRRVAGLDLDVMDHWTGISRSVSTLSGGEGFLAALALALGLADVIQSYTGGIHLEAVFIDEGFGSLDPEALEMAMRALEDLRESGRMVGLISHVGELKERIDTRLEVTRSRNGSSITVVRS